MWLLDASFSHLRKLRYFIGRHKLLESVSFERRLGFCLEVQFLDAEQGYHWLGDYLNQSLSSGTLSEPDPVVSQDVV